MKIFFKDISVAKWKIPFPVLLWFVLAVVAVLLELLRGPDAVNNYLIFKNVFWHTWHQQDLYQYYPAEYKDSNHYGPFFSLIIMPFALLPLNIGCFLWAIANAAFLFYAIQQLPFDKQNKNIILLIGVIEMMTSIHNVQFNPMLTAWIVMTFVCVEKEQDLWAALFIAAGLMVKLYGVVGIAFFWFSKHKIKFALWFFVWMIVLFLLPMLISSPAFIINAYKSWYHSLLFKNAANAVLYNYQDISVMGMIRRILTNPNIPNSWVILPAAVLHVIPLIRYKQRFAHLSFRLSYLAFALIGVVLFSSSAESATYVIAMTGVAIWFVLQKERNTWIVALLIFALVITSLSPTDLFPHQWERAFIRKYSFKALPCFLIWLVLAYQLIKNEFKPSLHE
jgi:hypothetical protein